MMRKIRQSRVEGESKTPAPALRDLKKNPEKTDRMQIRYQIGLACRQAPASCSKPLTTAGYRIRLSVPIVAV
jgi:hypothetical protein